jgi:hypothetical protein
MAAMSGSETLLNLECSIQCKEEWWWYLSDCLVRSVVQCNTEGGGGGAGDGRGWGGGGLVSQRLVL